MTLTASPVTLLGKPSGIQWFFLGSHEPSKKPHSFWTSPHQVSLTSSAQTWLLFLGNYCSLCLPLFCTTMVSAPSTGRGQMLSHDLMKVRAGEVLGEDGVQSSHVWIHFSSSQPLTELLLCTRPSATFWEHKAGTPQSPQKPLKNLLMASRQNQTINLLIHLVR